jgi:hypothetical protein
LAGIGREAELALCLARDVQDVQSRHDGRNEAHGALLSLCSDLNVATI